MQNSNINHKRYKFSLGKGLVNATINTLPLELHILGYNYCGPGTKLATRFVRGDIGINPLDKTCKNHDIVYTQNKGVEKRSKAEKILLKTALDRLWSSKSIGDKAAALGVAAAIKIKTNFGMGCIPKKKQHTKTKNRKVKSSKKIQL